MVLISLPDLLSLWRKWRYLCWPWRFWSGWRNSGSVELDVDNNVTTLKNNSSAIVAQSIGGGGGSGGFTVSATFVVQQKIRNNICWFRGSGGTGGEGHNINADIVVLLIPLD